MKRTKHTIKECNSLLRSTLSMLNVLSHQLDMSSIPHVDWLVSSYKASAFLSLHEDIVSKYDCIVRLYNIVNNVYILYN